MGACCSHDCSTKTKGCGPQGTGFAKGVAKGATTWFSSQGQSAGKPVVAAGAIGKGTSFGKSVESREDHPGNIVVSGCQHLELGEIVRGIFAWQGENHGRPTFKKTTPVNGLDVMLYFWDERDGIAFCGWWFGPAVGGDQVWAFHPNRDNVPPASGWRVPFNGPSDPTMKLSASSTHVTDSSIEFASQMPSTAMLQSAEADAWSTQALHGPGVAPQTVKPPLQLKSTFQAPNEKMPTACHASMVAAQQVPRVHRPAGQPIAAQSLFVPAPKLANLPPATLVDQKGQEEAKKKKTDENRKKIEEANRKRREEKEREQQKQLEEMKRREEAEEKQKRETKERKQRELKSANAIRKAQQKVRTASLANFEAARRELEAVLEAEMKIMGEKQQQVLEESEQVLVQAQQRIEMIQDQRRKEEEKKREEEKRAREKEEHAEEILAELSRLVEAAEASLKTLEGQIAAFTDEAELTIQEVEARASSIEQMGVQAAAMAVRCSEFFRQHHPEMKIPHRAKPEQPSEKLTDQQPLDTRQTLARLLRRTSDCKRDVEVARARGTEAKLCMMARALSLAKTQKMQSLFKAYDKDMDDMLSRRELLAYSRGEFDFEVPSSTLENIWDHYAEYSVKHGDRGLAFNNFALAQAAIGVAREMLRDGQRRVYREERERLYGEVKLQMHERIKEATESVTEADQAVSKTEEAIKSLSTKSKVMLVPEMLSLALEIDDINSAARAAVNIAQQKMEGLKEGVEGEFKAALLDFITNETKRHDSKLGRMEGRIKRGANLLSQFREEARRKRADEIDKVGAAALRVAKYNQQVHKLSNEELFRRFDASNHGSICKDDFVAFFETADKLIREVLCDDASEDVALPVSRALERGADSAEAEEAQLMESVQLDPADLAEAFAGLCLEKEKTISMEHFMQLITFYMVVVKETAMTDGLSIKDSQALRVLKLDEVVRVIRGPVKEKDTGVMRTHIKAMEDGIEGWVSAVGNAGTVFLKEGGRQFKVVREAVLTHAFELDGEHDSAMLCETNRRLKPGEEIEVQEWPSTETKSGLMRIKVRAKSDGAAGWVTSAWNQGTWFLKVL